jgi:hypothetical protein
MRILFVLCLSAGFLNAQTPVAKDAPKTLPATNPDTIVDVLDPTDGGTFKCPAGMVEALKAHIAAKQSGTSPIIASQPANCSNGRCNAVQSTPTAYPVGSRVIYQNCPNGNCARR